MKFTRIFSDPNGATSPRRSTPTCERVAPIGAPTEPSELGATGASPRPASDVQLDRTLSAVLDTPLAIGEPAAVGFARKERELGDRFARLTELEARALHGRLADPQPDDPLARSFLRLTADRRGRLLAFLADARRRAALAGRASRTVSGVAR